jgi:hypothetical protein
MELIDDVSAEPNVDREAVKVSYRSQYTDQTEKLRQVRCGSASSKDGAVRLRLLCLVILT